MSRVVFWATIALMLLACLNVTSLAVARVQVRWRDLAIHRSLGANRRHLARLLAIENFVVVAIGTGIGLAIARPSVAAIAHWLPASMSLIKTPAIDFRVIIFAIITAICAVAMITLGSVHAASRANVREVLAAGGRTTPRQRLWIVGAQVAVALVLTVGGALVAGSLVKISNVDVGLRKEGTALIRILMPGATASAIEELLSDVRKQPGVLQAGGIDYGLLQRTFNSSVFDRPPGAVEGAESIAVTTGYFAAVGLRATRGRLPSDAEIASGAPVLAVSERVAAEYWSEGTALGQSLTTGGRAFTVVGIVPDVRYVMLDEAPSGAIYWPMAANSKASLRNVVVSLDPAAGSLARLADWMRGRCPTCRISRVESLSDAMNWSIRRRLVPTWLLSSFGVAALVIVGVGLLGLVAMTTARRTREMGVRIALGATPLRIVRQVAGEQTAAVVIGLVAGSLIAAWAVRFVKAYLYEISTYDVWAWSAAIVVLLATAFIAALIPSIRAGRLDPVQALKTE
jgi:predicted permease